MTAFQDLDRDLLEKLLLGELPCAEVERLADKYADDARLSQMGELLAAKHETLVEMLYQRETVVDVAGERLVERLLARLRTNLSCASEEKQAPVPGIDLELQRGASNATENLPGNLEFYRPIKLLGQGGMGTVYLAEDTRLARQVAIKTLRAELAANAQAKERFLREARSAAMLEHDNIVPIYSVGEADSTPFLAMPLLKGEPLNELIQRTNGPLPVTTSVRLAREVAAGLAVAHKRGLIHRDIKPGNIWLEAPSGRVKILDFGLAKAVEVAGESTAERDLTAIGAIVGTPAYMAPEQANGDPVDGRADLFSLGCILYELLSGQRAFSGPTTFSILMNLASQTPIAPDKLSSACPSALSQLVMQLLEKDPTKRPASATAVIQTMDHMDLTSTDVPEDPLLAQRLQMPEKAAAWAVRMWRFALSHAGVLHNRVAIFAAVCLSAAISGAIFFSGPIVRVITNTGELVVQIEDPGVAVRIIQNGIVVVSDTTDDREFELKAVEGKIEVLEKNGVKISTKKFQLTRGETTTVTVTASELALARAEHQKLQLASQESKRASIVTPPSRSLADKPNPFLLVHSSGKSREEFGSLDGAIGAMNDGDIIEVHGNGPFVLGGVTLRGKGLRLRAATGYRPQLVTSKNLSSYFWFDIEQGVVEIVGCDLRCGNGISLQCFHGNGPSWTFRNCRLLGSDVAMISYEGPQLRFIDCLISGFSPPGYEGFSPGPGNCQLEMINTIVRNRGFQMLQARSDPDATGAWTVDLKQCTLYVTGGLIFQMGRKQYAKTTVRASASLMNVLGVANNTDLKNFGGWHSRDNLYIGPQAIRTLVKGTQEPVLGLQAWSEFWGAAEEGGREAEWAHYAWDEVRRQGHDPERVIQVLSPMTASLASQHGAAFQELGPAWDRVGPGDAYLRALEASGKTVSQDRLRPEPPAGGPFVLIRDNQIVRGYPLIDEGVAAAISGDVVEIRTDEPIGRCTLQGEMPRQLTIRAAPGYRPVVEGGFDFTAKNLSLVIEGIHFSKFPLGAGLGGNSTADAMQNSIARVANCSFSSQADFSPFAGRQPRNGINGPRFEAADGKPAEIVNCLIPGTVSITLPADEKLLVKNSVVGHVQISVATSGSRTLQLERCVLWNPCGDRSAIELHATDSQTVKSDIVVDASHTLFEAGSQFLLSHEGTRITKWSGKGNLYRVGHRSWLTEGHKRGAIGLADWKRYWNSDVDSVEADPVDYDPQQWRLLPSSPGYQAGRDGKDLGADVSRIGTIHHEN